MKKRVTMQDIADVSGFSRNTVSKVFNRYESVTEDVREKVLLAAKNLGYKQLQMINLDSFYSASEEKNRTEPKDIVLLKHADISGSHFMMSLLNILQQQINSFGYKLVIYTVTDENIKQRTLPKNFNLMNTNGILVVELFNKTYSDFICKQGIATLFVDTYTNLGISSLKSDIILMENYNSSYSLINSLIDKGIKEIGFVGDYMHCHSFFERFKAYRDALTDRGIQDYVNYCIFDNDEKPYDDIKWLSEKIQALSKLPQMFFCANDFIAIWTLKALKNLGFNVPQDIKLCGFDNSPESKTVDPELTTINIYKNEMANEATNILLSRIENPNGPYRTLYVNTDVIYRKSTE